MDDTNDIFSPEALRLLGTDQGSLDTQALESLDSRESTNTSRVHDVERTASAATEGHDRATSSPHTAASGFSTFYATTVQGPRQERTKFESKRRVEVAQVRKEGTCMRCRWNKIPVA